ncbi:MAG: hypothetical protein M3209_12115 [Acidobacteriota bacterium]|nr:hypothetical protein [Acidobacteriota bacterium]
MTKAVLLTSGLYIIIVSLPWSCGLCGEENIGEAYSTDGKYLARVYVRDCGATTGWLTHVNLRSSWGWFNPRWYGTITDGQVFANSCWSKVNLIWMDNSNLEIQYQKCDARSNGRDAAFMKESTWNGINISYRELPYQIENK